jgi:hypothetical protein
MHRLTGLVALVAIGFVVTACDRPPSAAAVACVDPAWRPAATPDAAVVLCLAPGYEPAGRGTRWARGAPTDSGYAWLTVTVLDAAAAATEWGSPPAPRSWRTPPAPGALHPVVAESVVVRREQIDGQSTEVETALVTGGFAGMRQQPALRAVWRLRGDRWVLAQGLADAPRELAILRAMLRTVRVRGGSSPSRGAT